MKMFLTLTLLAVMPLFTAAAKEKDDTPRGFEPYSNLEAAKAEARKEGKLLTIVAKGKDDACPHCAAAMEVGTKGLKTDSVMVFVRAETLQADRANLPPVLKAQMNKVIGGAAVAFLVFDPDMTELVTSTGRSELQKDPGSIRDTKKVVKEARKKLADKKA